MYLARLQKLFNYYSYISENEYSISIEIIPTINVHVNVHVNVRNK